MCQNPFGGGDDDDDLSEVRENIGSDDDTDRS